MTKLQKTVVGLILIILSIVFYRFPATYLLADITALVVTVICGKDMVIGAVRGVLKGELNVAELVTIAIIASLSIGEYLVAAEVAFIMTAGGYLEERVIDKSKKAIKDLKSLSPQNVRLKISSENWDQNPVPSEESKLVSINEIKPDDEVIVKPGEEVPVDGTILKGITLLSEASITGESSPIQKTVGDMVYAGSLNYEGALLIKTLKQGDNTILGRMVELTEKALEERTPTIRLADRFAAWFTPLVLSLTFLVYILSGDLFRAITVLVVLCPCTLVLAIPSALAASLGKSVKNGILLKGGVYLEKAAEIDTIIFDKTGTLTYGKPKIIDIVPFDGYTREQLLEKAAAAEKYSTHPIAKEIIDEARKNNLTIKEPNNVKVVPGLGMVAICEDEKITVSSSRFLKEKSHQKKSTIKESSTSDSYDFDYDNFEIALDMVTREEELGRTAFFVAVNNKIAGIISMEDILREDTKKSLIEIKKIVPNTILLTGDNYSSAYQISQETGISEFKAGLLPEEKVKVLDDLKKQGKTVAAVGDGINDAPLLAKADVGIAMGDTKASVLLDACSVVLLDGEFNKLSMFLNIARRTRRIIKQNIIVFAIIYNLAGFSLAAFGYLSPLGGAIVHNVGSTMVVLNSTRLIK